MIAQLLTIGGIKKISRRKVGPHAPSSSFAIIVSRKTLFMNESAIVISVMPI
jgi:hypothetical protein